MFGFRVLFTCLLLTVSVFSLCGAHKLLVVFPIPGKSHSILGEAFVKILLKAGHEVTYVTPILMKSAPEKLRQIDLSSTFDDFLPTEEMLNIEKIMKKEVDLFELSAVFEMMNKVANSSLMHKNVQKLLHDPEEAFDAVLIEWMYSELYAGFASVFDCPMIWSSSMEPHYLVLSLIDEDVNPAYTADIFTTESPPYSFIQRASKLWSYFLTRYKKWLTSGVENEIYLKAFSSAVEQRGRSLPPFDELKHNGSLMFGNSHVSAGQSLRLPQNYIPIAGYHIDSHVKPLPKDLKKIMDEAKHGVIYFSMGSMLKSTQVPNEIKRGILNVFAELKQTVIWKFEEQLQNTSKNLHIVNWAPQQSILAHPNCVLFITHGGLLSIMETLHSGVPVIGIPMFADQFNNINRAVNKGFGKRVDLGDETPVKLKEAIEEILLNPRYHERVKELSFVYHHRPVSPGAELVHWVEHVVRTRGATHLRSPALIVPWYQKIYLDLIAVVLGAIILVIAVLKRLMGSKKQNNKKTKKN